MKKQIIFVIAFVLMFVFSTYGQVSSLSVNGVSSDFTMTSGDQISWSFDVPSVGDTTLIEIWVDTDQNRELDPAVDVLWTYFIQIDGDPEGQNGPPDIDGEANGQVSFEQPVGLAPAEYIMVFRNHDNYSTVTGSVLSLPSPTFTISGTVTVPQGFSSQYIVLGLEGEGEGSGMFWDGLTDADGNFSIEMNSDTSGNPWRLRIDNQTMLGSSVITPDRYYLTIVPETSTYTGKDFTVESGAAEISGTVKDENGNPLINADVYLSANMGILDRNSVTDTNGTYHLGLLSNELPVSNLNIGAGDAYDTSIVAPSYTISVVSSGDNITRDFIIFKTNSTISGTVTLNGNPPGYNMPIWASNPDSGRVATFTGNGGGFMFHVTDKIFNYTIDLEIPQGFEFNSVIVHPGENNVQINLTLTDVANDNSNTLNEFVLKQNYPNPFNPSTKISWQSPVSGKQTIKVYNVLGNEVATLVDEDKPAGNYQVEFDAGSLPSGVYFYTLKAGSYTQTRKMILLK